MRKRWEVVEYSLKEKTVSVTGALVEPIVCAGKSISLPCVEIGPALHRTFTRLRLKTLDRERKSASLEAATHPETFFERSTRKDLFLLGIKREISVKSLLEAVLPV